MKKHSPSLILGVGLFFIFGSNFLIGFDSVLFGFTTSSNKIYKTIGIGLFGIGTLLTLIGMYLCFLRDDSSSKKSFLCSFRTIQGRKGAK